MEGCASGRRCLVFLYMPLLMFERERRMEILFLFVFPTNVSSWFFVAVGFCFCAFLGVKITYSIVR
jgi:hypothetical protein